MRFLQVAEDFTWINPHLSVDITWIMADGLVEDQQFEATESDWRKWLPSDPTSAHWYDVDRLERLAGAYVARDQDRQQSRTVRDLIADFRGMSGTGKQKAVLEATGMSRMPLSDLFPDSKADRGAFARLLTQVQCTTKIVKAKELGVIGEEIFSDQFRDCAGADTELDAINRTFKYKRILIDDATPAVIEVAFACDGDDRFGCRIITGVNWSVGINNPFQRIGYWNGLDGILQELRVGPDEPIIIVIHLAYPLVTFTDRGKSALAIPTSIATGIVKALTDVTKDWTRQRKAEERHASAARNRMDKLTRRRKVTIKEAAYEMMESAYLKAGGKTGTANARQVMYAARPHILQRTGREKLDDAYFTQTILPNYIAETGVKWVIDYDDRGHFSEPHTDRVIGLGTLAVRNYLKEISGVRLDEPSFGRGETVTCGPQGRFGGLLYVEKEGFSSLWNAAQIKERFDIAIMSCKGMSVTAARQLAEEICSTYGIPLYVLHDFDKSGVSIRASFQRSTRRYVFTKKFQVFDIGFRMEDVAGLEREPHSDPASVQARTANLRANGATEAEIKFLLKERVELNAMTSDQLVAFLERKLTEHGVKKIVPDDAQLAKAYALEMRNIKAEEAVRRELAKMNGTAVASPADLQTRVGTLLQQKPYLSWDQAICDIATVDAAKAA